MVQMTTALLQAVPQQEERHRRQVREAEERVEERVRKELEADRQTLRAEGRAEAKLKVCEQRERCIRAGAEQMTAGNGRGALERALMCLDDLEMPEVAALATANPAAQGGHPQGAGRQVSALEGPRDPRCSVRRIPPQLILPPSAILS